MNRMTVLTRIIFGLFLVAVSSHGLAEEESHEDRAWTFTLNPSPHIFKWGNIFEGNRLIIKVDENCHGTMGAFFASRNKEQLFEAKGKTLPVALSVSLFTHTEVIQSQSKVLRVDAIVVDGVEANFAMSLLDLVSLDHIDQLSPLGDYQMTTFDLNIKSDVIYDVPHESWDLKGFKPALNKAVSWCWEKQKRNLRHKASDVTFYVSL